VLLYQIIPLLKLIASIVVQPYRELILCFKLCVLPLWSFGFCNSNGPRLDKPDGHGQVGSKVVATICEPVDARDT